IRALMKLSRASGLYPECMTLNGIELAGRKAVAGGAFGDIWIASLKGQEMSVKILKVYQKSDMVKLHKAFSGEAVTWRQLKHQNVLPFYGVFRLEDDRLCLASPWMRNGNIVHFLESAPATKCAPLMLDIAEGLKYLHTFSPCIIHADLKGVNILISQAHRACLADFGLATAKDTMSFGITSSTTTRTTGTLRWQAPELLDPEQDERTCKNSPASDIYAYACVCYEVFSDQYPFHDITNDYRVMAAVAKGARPPRPSHALSLVRGLNNAVWNIVESCWSQDPNDRWSAHQIVERLRSLPGLVEDRRPFDDFDASFPARTAYSQAKHPFSFLTDDAYHDIMPYDDKMNDSHIDGTTSQDSLADGQIPEEGARSLGSGNSSDSVCTAVEEAGSKGLDKAGSASPQMEVPQTRTVYELPGLGYYPLKAIALYDCEVPMDPCHNFYLNSAFQIPLLLMIRTKSHLK
ncbi:hypothetical protein PILCRDRAFT_71097, partial [Piloderma croceum F 1598]